MFVFVMLAMGTLLMSNSGCDTNNDADSKIQKNQEIIMQQINDLVDMPGLVNYQ